MPHHYVESGLDNIFLDNGYTTYKTAVGEGAFIEDTENLHKVIGRWLVSLPKPLTGAELRFLRLEMEQTQRELATILGSLEPTLRLWERLRTKPMPGPADRLVRALYLEFIGEGGHVRKMLERLSRSDQVRQTKACLRRAPNHKWTQPA